MKALVLRREWGYVLMLAAAGYALTDDVSPFQVVDLPDVFNWIFRICGWVSLIAIVSGVIIMRRERESQSAADRR